MHIKNISIINFRNFSDFKINFTDGFQTIIGENNIGKSNLFWAIRLVLDKNLSYNSRNLLEKDFCDFPDLTLDSYVSISIEFYGENLSEFPNLHAIKTSDKTLRITYVFIHKSKLIPSEEVFDKIEIKDFQWRIYGGGEDFNIKNISTLSQIRFNDIDGINLYYISGFRNINSDLAGSTKSLLSEYCKSREDSEAELEIVKSILSESTNKLNNQDFMPKIADALKTKNAEIAGEHFTFPISLGFLPNDDNEVWNQLKIFYNPKDGKNIPMNILGLGQKNLLYLSLFLSKLINQKDDNEVNLLLIEEPEAHLHPQLQKILFANLGVLENTQVFMSSHSTHIASDCEYKNLNILYRNTQKEVKSFSPFINEEAGKKVKREYTLLKRYLDATRSELFFSSAVILVEGVAEQFIIPEISKKIFGINLVEHNISVIPIHSRYFDPFLKMFIDGNLELTCCAIIDGDAKEHKEGDSTTAVANARSFEVEGRIRVFVGTETLEKDLFPSKSINNSFLKDCFKNLNHEVSFSNLMETEENWKEELIKRIDGTVKKGRFAQELSLLIDNDFVVPEYITEALEFVFQTNNINYDTQ